MTDAPEREIAYQTYINEVMPNGNTRLDNIILSNAGDRAEQHIATQIDIAFQAGWSARADLATPLDDPRVKALVGLLKEARDDIEAYVDADWPENLRAQYPSYLSKWKRDMELCRSIDAALSALEENK